LLSDHIFSSGFRTDTEISKEAFAPFGEGRMLQKWADDTDSFSIEDERAFADMAISGGGNGTGKGGWDQFAANEARFGVKSNYEETLYTTKLDKTAKDFKDRERKADQLAKEIMSVSRRAVIS
jgi:PAB1-binding protein PBP1